MPAAATKSIYSVHPGVAMVQKWVGELKSKTGRSLEEWIKLCNSKGPKDEAKRRDWLKKEFSMGTNTAWWISDRSFGKSEEDSDPKLYLKKAEEFVADMYSGKKAGLKPVYSAILKTAKKLGREIRFCPCKTMVPIYRNHVIAEIKPSTLTRIDLGFALGPTKARGRLIDTGGYAKKDRITHRIPITSVSEIDAEVTSWLKKAYELDKK
ncbi:MAG TPA: DUF5655 domain-containing protein [Phycisphaerae bacterium]|nr:DUF5655 domain-containing protein [Phycisphaerae bacterium]